MEKPVHTRFSNGLVPRSNAASIPMSTSFCDQTGTQAHVLAQMLSEAQECEKLHTSSNWQFSKSIGLHNITISQNLLQILLFYLTRGGRRGRIIIIHTCLELDYPSQCMQSPSPSESKSRTIHLSSVHLLSSCHAEQKSPPIPLSLFHQVIRSLRSIITHQPIQPFCIPTHDPLSCTPPNPLTTLSSTTITPKRKHNTQQQRPQPSPQRYKTVR